MSIFNIFVLLVAISLASAAPSSLRLAIDGFAARAAVSAEAKDGTHKVRAISQGLNCSEAPSRIVFASFSDPSCAVGGLTSSAFFGVGFGSCQEDQFCNLNATTIDLCLSQNPSTLSDYQACFRANSPAGTCISGTGGFIFTELNATHVTFSSYNTSTCQFLSSAFAFPSGCNGAPFNPFAPAGYTEGKFLLTNFCCPANQYDDGTSATCVDCIGTVTNPTTCTPCDSDEYFNSAACAFCPGNATDAETCICPDGAVFDGVSCSSRSRSESSASVLAAFF